MKIQLQLLDQFRIVTDGPWASLMKPTRGSEWGHVLTECPAFKIIVFPKAFSWIVADGLPLNDFVVAVKP